MDHFFIGESSLQKETFKIIIVKKKNTTNLFVLPTITGEAKSRKNNEDFISN